jgi:hypothetical protein
MVGRHLRPDVVVTVFAVALQQHHLSDLLGLLQRWPSARAVKLVPECMQGVGDQINKTSLLMIEIDTEIVWEVRGGLLDEPGQLLVVVIEHEDIITKMDDYSYGLACGVDKIS